MNVGAFITYEGKEWSITAKGDWGLRCERGYGHNYSVIVMPWGHFTR